MLDNEGNLVLIDFGIGRKITNTLPEKIKSETVTQSYSSGYAPLEQEIGKASPQSDFFALGRTFIHLLTGQHPDEMAGSYRRANTDENWNWRSETQDCPDLLLDFIDFLSDKSPKKRPKDTAELLQRIEDLENNLFPTNKIQQLHDNNSLIKFRIQLGETPILGSLIERHSKRVSSLAISSDGKIIISGSDDASIKMWDIASGKLLETLRGVHEGSITSIIISPKLDYFASSSNDKRVCIWSYSDYTHLKSLPHSNAVTTLAIDIDGKSLISACSDGYIRLWDMTSNNQCHIYPKTSAANSLVITLNEQIIVSGHSDKKIIFWQCCEHTTHSSSVSSLAISPDGNYLVSGSSGNGSGEIFVWNMTTKKIITKIEGHNGTISSLAICPKNQFVVSASYADSNIKLWDIKSGEEIDSISAHTAGIDTLAITPDGKTIYSGSRDFSIRSWKIV